VAAVIHWQQQPLAAVLLLVSWQCNGSQDLPWSLCCFRCCR